MLHELHPVRTAWRSRRKQRPDQGLPRRGASVVEFAFVAPLLITLFLGIFEFSRILMANHVLTTAARSGAREAILPGATAASVEQIAQDIADAASIPLGNVTVVCSSNPATAIPGTNLSVTVSTPMSGISMIGKTWFPANHQVTATASMRKEGFE